MFVNNLDSSDELRHLLEVDTATVDRLRRAHSRGVIDNNDVSRIMGGLKDGLIDQQAVNRALIRANRLVQDHDVTALRVGSDANTRDPYYAVWYDKDLSQRDLVDGELPNSYKPSDDYPGYSPPHKSDGIVIEAQLDSETSFVRVHGDGGQQGPRMMPAEEFRDVATSQGKSGLESEYALLDGTPEYVSEVAVPEGERIRMRTVGTQDDLPGGGTQVEVRRYDRELEEEWFPQEPTSIDEYIDRVE